MQVRYTSFTDHSSVNNTLNNILTVLYSCSDGVGRTGTFICLHSQLERLKTEGVVDFFQAVKSARIQRAGLVPDAVRKVNNFNALHMLVNLIYNLG